jgi:hypothetical protein
VVHDCVVKAAAATSMLCGYLLDTCAGCTACLQVMGSWELQQAAHAMMLLMYGHFKRE